eukprot:3706335-Amphidinium_carterae.1
MVCSKAIQDLLGSPFLSICCIVLHAWNQSQAARQHVQYSVADVRNLSQNVHVVIQDFSTHQYVSKVQRSWGLLTTSSLALSNFTVLQTHTADAHHSETTTRANTTNAGPRCQFHSNP